MHAGTERKEKDRDHERNGVRKRQRKGRKGRKEGRRKEGREKVESRERKI